MYYSCLFALIVAAKVELQTTKCLKTDFNILFGILTFHLFIFIFNLKSLKNDLINLFRTGEEHQYVSIGRWKEKGKDKVVTEIEIVKPHSIKTGTWQTLMVRIRGDQATVNIDCKDVATQTLDGTMETYMLSGFLTLSQTSEPGAFEIPEIKNRFLVSFSFNDNFWRTSK